MEYTIQKNGNVLIIGDEIILKQRVDGTEKEQKFSFSENESEKLLICMEKYISSGGDDYIMRMDQNGMKDRATGESKCALCLNQRSVFGGFHARLF